MGCVRSVDYGRRHAFSEDFVIVVVGHLQNMKWSEWWLWWCGGRRKSPHYRISQQFYIQGGIMTRNAQKETALIKFPFRTAYTAHGFEEINEITCIYYRKPMLFLHNRLENRVAGSPNTVWECALRLRIVATLK